MTNAPSVSKVSRIGERLTPEDENGIDELPTLLPWGNTRFQRLPPRQEDFHMSNHHAEISSWRIAAGILLGTSKTSWAGANERVRVAVMGINGRGRSHLDGFAGVDGAEVTTLCEVDSRLFAPRVKEFFTDKGQKEPKTEQDIRRVLDDKDIDAVSMATPNHWHSLATVWACQAGKDVYVEKPMTHNARGLEGR